MFFNSEWYAHKMGLEAATKALLDAGITYDQVELAFVGYCYGDSTSGQVRNYITCVMVLLLITFHLNANLACTLQLGSYGHPDH